MTGGDGKGGQPSPPSSGEGLLSRCHNMRPGGERSANAGRVPLFHRCCSSVAKKGCKMRIVLLQEEETAARADQTLFSGAPHPEGPGRVPTLLSPHFRRVWSLRIASGWAEPPGSVGDTDRSPGGGGGRSAAQTQDGGSRVPPGGRGGSLLSGPPPLVVTRSCTLSPPSFICSKGPDLRSQAWVRLRHHQGPSLARPLTQSGHRDRPGNPRVVSCLWVFGFRPFQPFRF